MTGFNLPPGVTSAMIEDALGTDQPCAVCGQWEDYCICPECPVCGGIGDPYCYSDHDPNAPRSVDRTRDRGSYGTLSHGLFRSLGQVVLLAEEERQWKLENAIGDGYDDWYHEQESQ
jgi:hypothetical protein